MNRTLVGLILFAYSWHAGGMEEGEEKWEQVKIVRVYGSHRVKFPKVESKQFEVLREIARSFQFPSKIKYFEDPSIVKDLAEGFEGDELCLEALKIRMTQMATTYVGATDLDGNQALHYAAYVGNVRFIEALLSQKNIANEKNTNGYTPLFYACSKGLDDRDKSLAIIALLKYGDPKPGYIKDTQLYFNPVLQAARCGFTEGLHALLKKQALEKDLRTHSEQLVPSRDLPADQLADVFAILFAHFSEKQNYPLVCLDVEGSEHRFKLANIKKVALGEGPFLPIPLLAAIDIGIYLSCRVCPLSYTFHLFSQTPEELQTLAQHAHDLALEELEIFATIERYMKNGKRAETPQELLLVLSGTLRKASGHKRPPFYDFEKKGEEP